MNAESLIETEATIDTLVETENIHEASPKAYDLFRQGLTQLQNDLEKRGIIGKWKTTER